MIFGVKEGVIAWGVLGDKSGLGGKNRFTTQFQLGDRAAGIILGSHPYRISDLDEHLGCFQTSQQAVVYLLQLVLTTACCDV